MTNDDFLGILQIAIEKTPDGRPAPSPLSDVITEKLRGFGIGNDVARAHAAAILASGCVKEGEGGRGQFVFASVVNPMSLDAGVAYYIAKTEHGRSISTAEGIEVDSGGRVVAKPGALNYGDNVFLASMGVRQRKPTTPAQATELGAAARSAVKHLLEGGSYEGGH